MNKTKTILWVVIVIVVIVGVWYGLIKKQTPVTEKEPIKIGAILPLTGSAAAIGEDVKNGMKLATQKTTLPIEIIFEDNQSDVNMSVNAAQKLITQDRVKFLISWTSAATEAVAPVAENNKIILLYGTTIKGPAEKYNYVFKNFVDIEYDCGVLADYLIGKRVGLLGVIADSTSNCIKAFQIKGMDLKSEVYPKGTIDYRTMLSKLKKSDVEFLVLRGFPTEIENIFRQIKEIGLENKKIICPNISLIKCDAKNIIENYPDVLKNAIGTDFYIDTTNQGIKNFSEQYEKIYHKKPIADALFGYEDVLIFDQAANKCLNSENFIECVKNRFFTDSFLGVGENLKFDNSGIIHRKSSLFKFDGKSWVKI
jgi:branched-chain amino acid transport system substrate-binding protein